MISGRRHRRQSTAAQSHSVNLLEMSLIKPQRIYNPIAAMGFSAMFTS